MSVVNNYRNREKYNRNTENSNYNHNNTNNGNKNLLYKTKTEVLPINTKKTPNKSYYVKIDPENFEKKYNKEKCNLPNTRKDNNYNNGNNKISNSSTNSSIKKPFYLRDTKDRKSPIKYNENNFIYYTSNTSNNKSRKFDKNKNENKNKLIKNVSPVKFLNANRINNNSKYSAIQTNNNLEKNKNNRLYNNNNYNHVLSDKKNISENANNNININRAYRSRDNDRDNKIPSLNIYQKKLTTIFVRIIDKIISKHKKNEIMNKFFENLKNDFHNNNSESVDVPLLFNKKDSKYNEYKYKDIINNYSKTNNNLLITPNYNKNQNSKELINRMKNDKKDPIYKINNNNKGLRTKPVSNKKKDIKRLKELEKKYEKIYENKKNTSFDSNFRNYMLRKYKTQNSLIPKKLGDNNNNSYISKLNITNYNDHIFFDDILKSKLLKIKFMRNIDHFPEMNYSQEVTKPIQTYVSLKKYFTSTNVLNNKDKSYKKETPLKNKGKNIIKKLKLSQNRIKPNNYNNDNKFFETYKIMNIKDIQTSDKRLNVYINYITLYNDNRKKNYDYYDNDILQISNNFNFNYINMPLNRKTKKKKLFKNLDKIEEEPEDKSFNSSTQKMNKNRLLINNNIEEGILILEKLIDDYKKKIIKNIIINKKKEKGKDINKNSIRGLYKSKHRRDNGNGK